MHRKKVLFVITKSNYGGAQKYVYDLATHLPPEEFDVSVAAGGVGILFEKLHTAEIHTIPISSLSRDVKLFSDVRAFFELYRIFKIYNPDIIHLNSSKAGFIGALAARCLSIVSFLAPYLRRGFGRQAHTSHLTPRIVFTAHGWPFHEDRSFLARVFFFILSWKIVLLSHQTIATTQYVARSIHRGLFLRKKITLIPLGIEPPAFLPKEAAKTALLGDRAREFNSVPWIGTIAELHTSKDIDTTLRALHLLPNLEYVYVIAGEGEKRRHLEKKIRHLGLSDKVFLVGFKDNAATLMHAFDAFVLSSITESFGYVIAEALQAGVPVVATEAGGIPEAVSVAADRAALVPQKDYRALAESIKNTLEQKEKIEVSAPLYPIEEMIEQTARCYRDL